MDLLELSRFLNGRVSVRQYEDRPVPDSLVDEIIKVVRTAPSAGNLESWDVVVVTDEGQREMLSDVALSQIHVRQAPVVLVVVANYVRSMSRYQERGILYALEDATIAGTYLMLAAYASGLGSCWTGAFDDEAVRDVLSLPLHIRPVTLLTIGYTKEAQAGPERMPLSNHVHYDYWNPD